MRGNNGQELKDYSNTAGYEQGMSPVSYHSSDWYDQVSDYHHYNFLVTFKYYYKITLNFSLY